MLVRRVRVFLVSLVGAAGRRGLLVQAAALAWVTTLSLIPLLAAFSFVGAQLFETYRARILEAASAILPWPEETVLARIEQLVAEAESVRVIGFLSFLVITLGLFDAVERAINGLWGISRGRPLKSRLGSLAQLLFWGPIVIGLGLAALAWIETVFLGTALGQFVVALIVFVALAMLYHFVPVTRVRMRAAWAGAAIATLLLELLRHAFSAYTSYYLESGPNIYGSLALAVLFLTSIHLGWLALLLGALASAVLQRGPAASGAAKPDGWVGLAAMLALTRRLAERKPPPAADELPIELGADPDILDASLEVLQKADLIHRDDRSGLLVLTSSPFLLRVEDVLELFPDPTPEPELAEISEALAKTIEIAREGRGQRLDGRTLAGLLGLRDERVDLEPRDEPA